MFKKSRETLTSLNRGSIGLMVSALLVVPWVLMGCEGDAELVPNGGGGGGLPERSIGVDVSDEIANIPGVEIGTTTNGMSEIVAGKGETRIQAQQVQVVTVVDPEGEIRGAGLGGPQPRVSINTATTAATAVFLSPGIAVADPTQAAIRLEQIQNLDAFAALNAHIAANIGAMSWSEILGSDLGQELLADCVEEWWNENSLPATGIDIIGTDTAGGVKLAIQDVTSGGIANLLFQNNGWRHVAIVETSRRETTDRPARELGVVPGKTPANSTDILFGNGGVPGTMTASTDFNPTNGATEADYLVVGLGHGEDGDLPSGVSLTAVHQARLFTAVDYMMLPVLSIVTGIPIQYLYAMKPLLFASTAVQSAMLELYTAFQAGEDRNTLVAAAFSHLMLASAVTIVSFMSSHEFIKRSGGLTLLNILLTSPFVLYTLANMLITIQAFSSIPAIARLRVAASGEGEIIIRGRE